MAKAYGVWREASIPANYKGREEEWIAKQANPENYRRAYTPGQGYVVEVKAAIPEAKQPWQMTREEYVTKEITASGRKSSLWRGNFAGTHEAFVEQAAREGKTVPPEVLKDYPDLKSISPKAAKQPWDEPTYQIKRTLQEYGQEHPERWDEIINGEIAKARHGLAQAKSIAERTAGNAQLAETHVRNVERVRHQEQYIKELEEIKSKQDGRPTKPSEQYLRDFPEAEPTSITINPDDPNLEVWEPDHKPRKPGKLVLLVRTKKKGPPETSLGGMR